MLTPHCTRYKEALGYPILHLPHSFAVEPLKGFSFNMIWSADGAHPSPATLSGAPGTESSFGLGLSRSPLGTPCTSIQVGTKLLPVSPITFRLPWSGSHASRAKMIYTIRVLPARSKLLYSVWSCSRYHPKMDYLFR